MLKSQRPTQQQSLGLKKPFRSPLVGNIRTNGTSAAAVGATTTTTTTTTTPTRPLRPPGMSLKRLFPSTKHATPLVTPKRRKLGGQLVPSNSDTSENTTDSEGSGGSSIPSTPLKSQKDGGESDARSTHSPFMSSRRVFAAFKSPLRLMPNTGSGDDNDANPNGSDQTVPCFGGVKRPSGALGFRRAMAARKGPRHDPNAEDAIVLYQPPTPEELALIKPTENCDNGKVKRAQKSLKSILEKSMGIVGGKSEVAVVLDPILGRKLRPHQVEGVKFLFDCVTGRKIENSYGCIMADEMGLGKTLQCIALLWTLLKQSPDPAKPYIDKCIIACPSSLVKNWANELVKWLGSGRIQPLVSDGLGSKLKSELRHFATSRGRMNTRPVLIISYETLRSNVDVFLGGQIGLLLCDEGHRLKNSASQTFQALASINVQKRVILSGTPIQNDLTEYFSLLNFANPGLLGTPNEFRRKYEHIILRGRDADATEKERDASDMKLAELTAISNKVIIRRTNDLLSKYLPIKYEHVVFCPLRDLQRELYTKYLSTKAVRQVLANEGGGGGGGDSSLQAVTLLKKLCNHPNLLRLPSEIQGSKDIVPPNYYTDMIESTGGSGGGFARRKAASSAMSGMGRCFSGGGGDSGGCSNAVFHPKWSGKMALLDRMLRAIRKSPEKDKIVLISNYTQTLDLFEKLCQANGYGYHRLDGSMQIAKRQRMVEQFNNPKDSSFVFLLSSKAGGCGINLIGANRLVLFDPDWNPASDQQALARVWRDGQKKTCYIYRFVAMGSIEEKIFQRQSHKQSLSSCVVDERLEVERHFSREQMRQLFEAKIDGQTLCDTHDTFKCRRCVKGRQFTPAKEPMDYGDTSSWDHFSKADANKIYDSVLKSCMGNDVSYVFQYKSH
ncbi:DNA-dependent ATPase protein rad54 [Mycoemilia scoparia]|uniref:DNA-dependent ATPase protein rad54 n=1 Tax=Mycoemilia scoparia TaxID=417184 RepID=A0A9W8A528_9FUNG|nr:DNA-dependent ATPase protein rad54 [Mycoemilia scoparia]